MKKFAALLLALLSLTAVSLAEAAPVQPIELGLAKAAFRMQVIDAKTDDAVKNPVVYADVAYEARMADMTVGMLLAQLDDLLALTMQKDTAGAVIGMKAVSYESNPITEYPERLNDAAFQWKAFVNGQPAEMMADVKNGDLVQMVYTDALAVPEKADDTLANRYYFVKNDTVCYDFSMSLNADEKNVLASGDYRLYVPFEKAGTLYVSDLVEAVCAHHGLDYAFDGMSVSIGDQISEQDAQGNYHYWYLKDTESGMSSSLGLGGEWGLKAGAGMNYTLYFK